MNEQILTSLSYGLYALGVRGEHYPSACIVNTVFQVTASPPIIAVSINHNNYSHECILKEKKFCISVLSEETPSNVIGTLGFYSGRNKNKLSDIKYSLSPSGLPIIEENICCWFECNVINSIETPTHTIFISDITNGSNNSTGVPMTYSYYHNVIKGSSSKNKPTHSKNQDSPQSNQKYICTICGYVYDGDIPFEDLPDDWVCPICSVPKTFFTPC